MQALSIDPRINSYVIIGKSPGFRFILLGTFPTDTLCLISGIPPICQRSQLWFAAPDFHRIPRYRVAATNDLIYSVFHLLGYYTALRADALVGDLMILVLFFAHGAIMSRPCGRSWYGWSLRYQGFSRLRAAWPPVACVCEVGLRPIRWILAAWLTPLRKNDRGLCHPWPSGARPRIQ
jgi:hypothetical protein